jgi:hypothetical protein
METTNDYEASEASMREAALDILGRKSRRVISAWLAMRVQNYADTENAAERVYAAVCRSVGADEAGEPGEKGAPPAYEHYVDLARQHGVQLWPVLALAEYLHEITGDGDTNSVNETAWHRWDGVLEEYERHHATLRRRRGIIIV